MTTNVSTPEPVEALPPKATSARARTLIDSRPDLDWQAASSSREDGRLTLADVRAFIERCDSGESNTPQYNVSFDPSDGRTWIDKDHGVTPNAMAEIDQDAATADKHREDAAARLDRMMLNAARVYAHKMGIRSGHEPGASKLDPFSKGMKRAFPRTSSRKSFASYVSTIKRMLSYGLIPFETDVETPTVRYTPKEGDSGSIKTIERHPVTVESIGQWRQDFWIEQKTKGAGLWCPAISKRFGENPGRALASCKARLEGEKNDSSPAPGDEGSELFAELQPKDTGILKEVAEELRRARKAGCLDRVRSLIEDALAEAEKAAEEAVRSQAS